jgi:hypothetical protein
LNTLIWISNHSFSTLDFDFENYRSPAQHCTEIIGYNPRRLEEVGKAPRAIQMEK